MSDPRINLKNPYLAALLAFLLPGAGHLYQGRHFKAALYSVCILGTFLCGMALGDWQVVYWQNAPGRRVYGYFAQVMVGLPALPAVIQSRRWDPSVEALRTLEAPIDAPFEGTVVQGQREVAKLKGRIHLAEVATEFGPAVRGTFEGLVRTTSDGVERQQTFDLAEGFRIDPPVMGSPQRRLRIGIAGTNGRDVVGHVPRSFWNWFEAPPGEEELQRLHGALGKFFELASVFTWIAGLLNILAIWDALEGPAYGYGDEPPAGTSAEKTAGTTAEKPPETAPAPREPAHSASTSGPPPPDGPSGR